MDFLYRIPLFQFDISNQEEIAKNWEEILEAIKFSSKDFYDSIKSTQFDKLDQRSKIKLYKYLIRGRFRPTPFGKLAGVGLGKWSNAHLPIQFKDIKESTKFRFTNLYQESQPKQDSFRLVPGISKRLGYIQAYIYNKTSSRWKLCKILPNRVFDLILEKFAHSEIDYKRFSIAMEGEFGEEGTKLASEFWNMILETGFLYPARPKRKLDFNSGNTFLGNLLKVSNSVEKRLDEFVKGSGNLFVKEKSPYLTNFKKWFADCYDDRYITLANLLENPHFKTGLFSSVDNASDFTSEKIDIQHRNLSEIDRIDLEKTVSKIELAPEIFDVQVLFRLDVSGNTIIENIVCNRPFVYIGRFNQYKEIKAFSGRIKERIYQDQEFIYANIGLMETPAINTICDVENIFEWEISPLPNNNPKNIGYEDIWIGLLEGRILLYHEKTGKVIVPVVLHPLNGKEISHPIQRLLWEIAHQDRFRFLPYTMHDREYSPGYYWEGLCIQPKRWQINLQTIPSQNDLRFYLDQIGISDVFHAGNQDQELLINRKVELEMEVLWDELKKKKKLTLCEVHWYQSNSESINPSPRLYPQFVYQFSKPIEPVKRIDSFNPQSNYDKNWLCLVLESNSSELEDTLEKIGVYLSSLSKREEKNQWFYVVYPKLNFIEIRIRFLISEITKKHHFSTKLSFFFDKENINWKTAKYYPEFNKYGKEGLQTSEHLFCLESDFILLGSSAINQKLFLEETLKKDIVVALWKMVFQAKDLSGDMFILFKNMVKRFTPDLTARFKREFKPVMEVDFHQFPIEDYLFRISRHEFYNKTQKEKENLLLNHLHMMINRFFPMNSFLVEKELWYRLYRELGREIFKKTDRKKSIQNAENHRIT